MLQKYYHVVFFDSENVTRAWISADRLFPYVDKKIKIPNKITNKIKIRLQAAQIQAEDATTLTLGERLEKYSFLTRFKGKIRSPRKISKQKLRKFSRKYVKKFNVNIPSEDSDESVVY